MNYDELKKTKLIKKINQRLIPVNQIDFSEESIDFFNKIIIRCNEQKFNRIQRTNSGSFSYSNTILPAYDVRATKSLIELTYCAIDGMFRLQVRTVNKDEEETDLSGWKSFIKFKNLCKKYNIDLSDYEIDNGNEVKKEIEKYMIDLGDDVQKNTVYTNAHHLDFHSSFPSGLVNTHPEFRPVIEKLYKERKIHPEYKYILNSTIGYMQSQDCCKAKWAHLSRDAINDNNKRIRELTELLIQSGRKILAYNTDGIWYSGRVFHGKGEGKNICEWENDHKNCIIRFKSKGSYEFIDEDGSYNPVVRGRTLLDDIKDRSEWKWGDIYQENAKIKKIKLNDNNTLEIVFREA